jgi:hypothetical protein
MKVALVFSKTVGCNQHFSAKNVVYRQYFLIKLLVIGNTFNPKSTQILGLSSEKFGLNQIPTNSFPKYYKFSSPKKFGLPFQPYDKSVSFVLSFQKSSDEAKLLLFQRKLYLCPHESTSLDIVFPFLGISRLSFLKPRYEASRPRCLGKRPNTRTKISRLGRGREEVFYPLAFQGVAARGSGLPWNYCQYGG